MPALPWQPPPPEEPPEEPDVFSPSPSTKSAVWSMYGFDRLGEPPFSWVGWRVGVLPPGLLLEASGELRPKQPEPEAPSA